MQEMRKDPVTGRWVIIAPGRARRPTDFSRQAFPRETFLRESSQINDGSCPFCEGHESETPPEIFALRPATSPKDSPGWTVRVVANKFPALSPEGNLDRKTDGMLESMDGVGAHEVIIESPDHSQTLATMSEEQIGRVFRTFRDRMLDLKRDKRFQYILIFKNQGPGAGATLQHPHSQLVALPVVPRQVIEELRGAENYFKLKEHCIFCDTLQQELASGIRVIDQNEDFVTLAPYASRFPFEACILPRRHQPAFESAPPALYESLARPVKTLMAKFDIALKHPAFNLVIHTAPLDESHNDYYHWHIEIMPKLSKIGGFELGTGFYINPMPPEEAARVLRETIVQLSPPGAF